MHGLIILEGPDGVGKTTLARYFVEHHGAHYMHLTYRFKQSMFTYHAAALHRACKLSETRLVVVDRLWISEALYAEAFRGGSPWPHMGRMMDRVIRKHAGLYILCLPSGTVEEHEAHFQNLRTGRQEMYESIDTVTRLYTGFAYGDPNFPGTGYCRDIARAGGFLKRRSEVLQYRIAEEGQDLKNFTSCALWTMQASRVAQYEPALNPYNYNFLGHARKGHAKFVFIGDKINPEKRQIHYPFYAHKNSSLFLAECLSEIGFDETQAIFTNINDPGGIDHVVAMVNDHWLIPVNMGYETQKPLKFTGNRFVAHPSYGRRFMGKEKYCAQLKEALWT